MEEQERTGWINNLSTDFKNTHLRIVAQGPAVIQPLLYAWQPFP
jgi:hypothetical protein